LEERRWQTDGGGPRKRPVGIEEDLGNGEALGTDVEDLTVGQFVLDRRDVGVCPKYNTVNRTHAHTTKGVCQHPA
jgi:hypothetical protein